MRMRPPAPRLLDTSTRGRQERTRALLFAGLVFVLLLGKAFVTRWLTLADGSVVATLRLEAPLLAAVVLLVLTLTRRWRWALVVALLVVDVALTFVMAATAVYAAYFEQVPTADLLILAREAAGVDTSIRSLLAPVHLIYIADLPLVALAGFVVAYRGDGDGRRRWPAGPSVVLSAAAAAVIIIAAIGVVNAARIPIHVDSLVATRAAGLLDFQVGRLTDLIGDAPTADAAGAASDGVGLGVEIERTRGLESRRRLADFAPGAYKNKNVIIVQVESLETALIGLKVDGHPVTPQLNRLIKQSWYFPRTHSQIARGNTADAEFICNASLYPPIKQAASVRWATKEIPALPRLLTAEGYRTVTIHANEARYWNRAALYASLGFSRYYDRQALGPPARGWMWGVSDDRTFAFALKQMKSMRAKRRPFYVQVVTMTSHRPFELPPAAMRPLKPRTKGRPSLINNYVGSESYADAALGRFVAALKRSGLWDDSVVIVFGDHFGTKKTRTDSSYDAEFKRFYGRQRTILDAIQIPLIVHLPGQTRGVTSTEVLGQVDIMPTVADLLGLDLRAVPHVGRSAFAGNRRLIGFRGLVASGSMTNERIVFMPGFGFDDGSARDITTGEVVTPTALDRRDYEAVSRLLDLSLRYTDALPQRAGAKASKDAIIPNE